MLSGTRAAVCNPQLSGCQFLRRVGKTAMNCQSVNILYCLNSGAGGAKWFI